MDSRSRKVVLVAALVAALGAIAWMRLRPSEKAAATRPAAETCDARVTKAELERSIELGTRFMIAHQKAAGNFDYEYDWKTKKNATNDNAARQSGALWGISLLHGYAGAKATPELDASLARGLAYFDERSVATKEGGRYPVYRGDGDTPTETTGGVGMHALVTLAIVEYVRSLPADATAERTKWTARANEYIRFLVALLRPEGTWPASYLYETGAGVGVHSPYSDGEALLALVISMKYLGRDDLLPIIERAASEGHRVNVEEALLETPDSDTTKGYYQWSSMAYYELATSKTARAAPYGDWLLALADWVLDVHHVIGKPRNTGYAFEGIVSALAWARATKDPRAEKYLCATHTGLATLLGWQVGHPRAASLGGGDDPKAVGGVQNHAVEAPLRIDTVQHQMHATMMAVDHLFQ